MSRVTRVPAWSPTPPERPARPARGDHRRQPRTHGAAVPRARGAGRGGHRPPLDLGRAGPRRRRAGPRPDRGRHREGRPGRHLGAELRGVDARRSTPPRRSASILVNVNPAYRTHEFAYALNQCGHAAPVSATELQDQRLPGDGRARCAPDCPALERVVYVDTDDLAALVAEGETCRRTSLAERMATLSPDDPINIQYTSGTTGLPQGRDAEPPQHPQQRLLHHRADQPHRAGPALHPGALLPLLRDGDGATSAAPPTAPRW